ncbi:MAG: hypothetical protein JST54_13160 [Deltaproteobacteria bacterium]|nr:hypothetical protein [Deltaproteobacteria bacterium]
MLGCDLGDASDIEGKSAKPAAKAATDQTDASLKLIAPYLKKNVTAKLDGKLFEVSVKSLDALKLKIGKK